MISHRFGWVVLTLTLVGCGAGGDSPPISPVVAPDSDAARRARAEDEALVAERQNQEARARKRVRNLPTAG